MATRMCSKALSEVKKKKNTYNTDIHLFSIQAPDALQMEVNYCTRLFQLGFQACSVTEDSATLLIFHSLANWQAAA